MFTFIVMVAVAAFVPYVATPGIANGVKAISAPAPAPTPAAMIFDTSPAAASSGADAANRIVSGQRADGAAV